MYSDASATELMKDTRNMSQVNSPSEMVEMREYCQAAFARQKVRFRVCAGTACIAGGSLNVFAEFKRLISEKGIDVDVELLFEGQETDAGAATSGCCD